jgi:hypothetical protein
MRAMIQEEIIKIDKPIIIQKINKKDQINFKLTDLLDQKKELRLDKLLKISLFLDKIQFKIKY